MDTPIANQVIALVVLALVVIAAVWLISQRTSERDRMLSIHKQYSQAMMETNAAAQGVTPERLGRP
jgi:hypothetical protein